MTIMNIITQKAGKIAQPLYIIISFTNSEFEEDSLEGHL